MSNRAPNHPTTEQLHAAYPVSDSVIHEVAAKRQLFSDILSGNKEGFIDINGSCGVTDEEKNTVRTEAQALQARQDNNDSLVLGYRACVYKPRTNPDDWHGMETSHPQAAHELLTQLAIGGSAVAMEVAHPYHLERYGRLLAFGWIGSRNIQERELINHIGMASISLPLGVKNGLDGTIDEAIEHVARINEIRCAYAQKLGTIAAPAVLVYRGGENAQTPEAWEKEFINAYEATAGQLIVDTAHGAEMAHHPEGIFQKSIEGQNEALKHLLSLAEQGFAPLGKLSEASDIVGQTDPNTSLEFSLQVGQKIHELKAGRRGTEARVLVEA